MIVCLCNLLVHFHQCRIAADMNVLVDVALRSNEDNLSSHFIANLIYIKSHVHSRCFSRDFRFIDIDFEL